MNWYDKLKQVHDKGDKLRVQATSMAAKLGHRLEGWTAIQNCRCRKCGAYAKINGVLYDHNGKTFEGAAFTNKCNVNFENGDQYKWQPYTNPWPKNALASKMDTTRQLNEMGVPVGPAADLAVKLDDDDEFKDILDGVRLIREEKLYNKLIRTVGTEVEHIHEDWVGTIMQPPKTYRGVEMVMVRHPFQDGSTRIMADRFYNVEDLWPTQMGPYKK